MERTAQTKRKSDRALHEKRAAEQGLPSLRPMKRTRIDESQAESSAAGASARANPSSETTDASGIQHGTNPQLGSPQPASSHAPAPGNIVPHQEEIDETLYTNDTPEPESSSSHAPAPGFMPGSGSEDLLPYQEEIDETLYTNDTLEPELPSSHAPAPGFMPGSGSENPLPQHAGTEALSSHPAPEFQHGMASRVPIREALLALTRGNTVRQYRGVPQFTVDPFLRLSDPLPSSLAPTSGVPGSSSNNPLPQPAGPEALSSHPPPGFPRGTHPPFQAPPVPQPEAQLPDPISRFVDILGVDPQDRPAAEQLLRRLGYRP
ncbi:hypothetical protein MMC07_009454 [Pseudocyphellaria aurata]|nr:hypothetical protein [Pseudocyphellaria aurata]